MFSPDAWDECCEKPLSVEVVDDKLPVEDCPCAPVWMFCCPLTIDRTWLNWFSLTRNLWSSPWSSVTDMYLVFMPGG